MDIIDCKAFRRQYAYSARASTNYHDGRGDDITLERHAPVDDNDPLSILIAEEDTASEFTTNVLALRHHLKFNR